MHVQYPLVGQQLNFLTNPPLLEISVVFFLVGWLVAIRKDAYVDILAHAFWLIYLIISPD